MKSDNKDNRDAIFNDEARPIVLNIKGETKKPKDETKDLVDETNTLKSEPQNKPEVNSEPAGKDDFLSEIEEAINGGEENQKKKKKKLKIIPDSIGIGIAMLVTGFAEVLFLMFVLALDVLPLKYLILLIVALVIIDLIIIYLATSESKYGTRRIGCLVIVFTMLITLLAGDYYIYSTADTLNKISKQEATWENYCVMVSAEGSYNKVKDITGETVYVPQMESKQMNEARERLITKADVSYQEEPDFMTAAKHLVPDKKDAKAEDAIVLLSGTQRQLANENLDGFKENTKCIYKIKVKKRANDNSKSVDVTTDSFNILISGIDVWGGVHKEGLSDVNMVMTVNPVDHKILLTSIPRDSYVTLHSYGGKDKLTHTGVYGAEETKKTIEDFLGIDINYSVRVNFAALVDLVNAVGGIDVYSDYEFKSSISHWTYEKGWNSLTGHSALYFARERKSFEDGDMQRNKQQQIVLEALLKKITNSKVILANYTKILDAIENDISTDMPNEDIKKLVKMQLKDMPKWEIKKANIEGPTGSAPCYSMGNRELSCVFPSEESVNEAKEKIHDTMYPAETQKKKKKTNSNDNNGEEKQ